VVDSVALRNAKTVLWTDAAADWRALAADLSADAEDLQDNVAPVASPGTWTGTAAAAARVRIADTVAALQNAQQEANLVNETLQRLADAITACQQNLAQADDLAQRYQLTVSEDGSVASAASSAQTDVVLKQVQELMNDALESATQADAVAAANLSLITGALAQSNSPSSGTP
jgi:hypothetical protein